MRILFSLGFALLLPAALLAQHSEMREILDRLQRLEDQNRELVNEVRSLRQELAAVRSAPAKTEPATAAFTQPPSPPQVAPSEQGGAAAPLEERVGVNEQRIAEQQQSKVEAEHKLPVRLTGMLLFNAFMNGNNSGGQQFPIAASLPRGAANDGGTLRQSILGLQFDGPRIFGGGTIGGSLSMDFWAGAGTSLNQLVRLRTASLDFSWANTTFSVGQDKPILAPRNPTSLAQVAFSPLTGAGNLWLWEPQARIEQRFHFGENTGLRAQLGVYQTSESSNVLPSGYDAGSARPSLEGRFELWHQFSGGRRIEIAPGFHVSNSRVEGVSVPSRVVSVDWLIRPAARIDFTGMFFSGENVGVLGGLRQGISILYYDRIRPTPAKGGWGQLTFRATDRLSFNAYGGEEDDRNYDLASGAIGRNITYAGNVMYRFGSNVLASFEAAQTRTDYIGAGLRTNPHYDLGLAYLY